MILGALSTGLDIASSLGAFDGAGGGNDSSGGAGSVSPYTVEEKYNACLDYFNNHYTGDINACTVNFICNRVHDPSYDACLWREASSGYGLLSATSKCVTSLMPDNMLLCDDDLNIIGIVDINGNENPVNQYIGNPEVSESRVDEYNTIIANLEKEIEKHKKNMQEYSQDIWKSHLYNQESDAALEKEQQLQLYKDELAKITADKERNEEFEKNPKVIHHFGPMFV